MGPLVLSALGELAEGAGVDADGKHRGGGGLALGGDAVAMELFAVERGGDVAAEIVAVGAGLEADDVIDHERVAEPLLTGNGREDLRRGEGRVQEKADARGAAPAPQFLGQRDQMIVVDPDQIVGAESAASARRRTWR